MNKTQLKLLKSAMRKDFGQLMIDSMTPDRGYAFPTDNVVKFIEALPGLNPKKPNRKPENRYAGADTAIAQPEDSIRLKAPRDKKALRRHLKARL